MILAAHAHGIIRRRGTALLAGLVWPVIGEMSARER
jgi:hypothetical protein